LRVTNAVLGDFKRKNNERIVLSVTHVDFIAEENRNSPLCVFSGNTEFVNLDMVIDEGEPVTFRTNHEEAVIHLNGYYLMDDHDDEDDDDDILEDMRDSILQSSDEDEEFDPNDISMESGDLSEDDEESDEDVPRVEVLEDKIADNILDQIKQKTAQLSKKRTENPSSLPEAKKSKTEEKQQTPTKKQQETPTKKQDAPNGKKAETPKGKQAETPKGKQAETPKGKQAEAQKGKQAETPKGKQTASTPAKSPISPRQLKGGLKIEVLKPSANNTIAKKGNKVNVQYVGRLATNKKVFDQGKITFPLGAGRVIKGWDQGLENMPVGETRKLIIPPQLAYGKSALDGIPANSTLEFEVTLLSVKG
jgi:FKBP-type peptidyl-prolyl cis-trans isomerase